MKDGEKDKSAKKARAGAAKGKAKGAPTATAAAAPAGEEKKPLAKSEKLASAAGKIAPGEWHTMLVEVQGTKVTVQTDTGLKAEASNAELDVDKNGYRFVTPASIQLDDVKAWSVE